MSDLIYLLEDDADITRLIERALTKHGLEVRSFNRMAEFQTALNLSLPDLCLIDLSLPDGDGLSLVHDAKLPASVPRVIVTGRGNLADKVVGLEIGADDYIVKPFEPRELVARIRAVLRRNRISKTAAPAETTSSDPANATERATFGEWIADFEACTLAHADGDVQMLSSAESALLRALVSTAGRVQSRSQLLDATSGRIDEPYDRSMDARISRLRRKLREDSRNPTIIRTVYGTGYVFSLSVEWMS